MTMEVGKCEAPMPRDEKDHGMTVAEWIDANYKPDRLHAEPGRRERIIANREKDLREHGEALISHHDSVTGKTVKLYWPG